MKRVPAEWEQQKLLQIVFPHKNSDWEYCLNEIQKSYVEIIKKIIQYQPCLVICDDMEETKKLFIKNKNLQFAQVKTNDTWIRDFGGIDVVEDDIVTTLDFGFNGWGLKYPSNFDNQVTRALDKQKLLPHPIQTLGLILEGGSIDSNGEGVILTTSQCLMENNRNPHLTKKEIEKSIFDFLGAKQVIWLDHAALKGDDTDSHIDTLARFLDKNTICYVKCHDKNDKHFEELQKMEKELKKYNFNLLPLPLPKAKYFENRRLPATYINFLFINNAVLVPTYNDIYDEEVIQTFENFFTDKEIIPVDCSLLIRENGSLHCATINRF